MFYHQSRHLSDRPKIGAVDWNMAGRRVMRDVTRGRTEWRSQGRCARVWCKNRLSITGGNSTPKGAAGSALVPRVSLISAGGVRVIGVDGTRNRGNQTGFLAEGGVRFEGNAAAMEFFVAAERRIDPFPLEFGTVTWLKTGFRLLSSVTCNNSDTYAWLAAPPRANRRRGPRVWRGPRAAGGRCSSSQAAIRDDDAAEWAARDPLGGSLHADRPRLAHVPRRLEERAAWPHRLRAPLRAHDVQGLEERRAGAAHVDHFRRRRPQQRLHHRGRNGLLADAARALHAARALDGSRPHGHAARGRRGVPARARGRQGRAADAHRQPAVRPVVRDHLRPRVRGASLQEPDDRQHGRPRGRVDRGRARVPPDVLCAGERNARRRRRLRSPRRHCSW